MIHSHKLSFYVITGFIFLLPLFFVPGGALPLSVAKPALLVLAVVLGALLFAYESWREGRVIMPKHYLLLVAGALPLVYLLSALIATPSSLSLFGYNFETGTFGFVLLGAALLILSSALFIETPRSLRALSALFVSLVFLAIIVTLNILFGPSTLLGVNKMSNPLGSWTDLGIAFGLTSALSALAAGIIPMKASGRSLTYAVFLLSTALLAVIGYSVAFTLALAASVALLLYFLKIENRFPGSSRAVLLPAILGVVALVFLINPNISQDRTLSGAVSGAFGIDNSEVRPSFSATLGVSKAVLSQMALLGSGPNTWSSDWLIYKPRDVNATPFWATAFPSGAGFFPTQIATTGVLGSALWLAFLIIFLALGVRALSRLPESRADRLVAVSSFLAAAFLWAASFLYVPSLAMLLLAFILTGVFLGSLAQAGVVPALVADMRRTSQSRLASAAVIVLVVLGALSVGWVGYGKTAAAYHFSKAVRLSNVEGTPLSAIEASLVKAVDISPTDAYFVALSRLNFSRAQMAANNASSTPEENKAVFDESVKKSIEAARLAVNANPAGYENWVALGTVYAALTPKPLSVEGAYENALFAYNEAVKRNPSNPELMLLLARLELNKEDKDTARSYLRNAIALKPDYADAYLMLAQLEVAAGNTAAAVASAENLAILVPDNPGIYFELGVLKFSSKNYEGAAESFGRALALSSDYANARYYLGLSLANLGRFAEAQTELEKLLQASPDNPELLKAIDAVKTNKVPVPPQPAAATPSQ